MQAYGCNRRCYAWCCPCDTHFFTTCFKPVSVRKNAMSGQHMRQGRYFPICYDNAEKNLVDLGKGDVGSLMLRVHLSKSGFFSLRDP